MATWLFWSVILRVDGRTGFRRLRSGTGRYRLWRWYADVNLTVQNEFDDKHLGVATATVSSFRGLGSTQHGTHRHVGLLELAYPLRYHQQRTLYQSLQRVPEARQMIGGDIDITALQINNQRQTISDQAAAGINKSPLPPAKTVTDCNV